VILIVELKIPNIKGCDLFENRLEKMQKFMARTKSVQFLQSGAKGQALATVLAQKQEIQAVMGITEEIKPSMNLEVKTSSYEVQPPECFEIISDVSQILDVLAEKYNLKKTKKFGNQFCNTSNLIRRRDCQLRTRDGYFG
jgi:hypothetical protein